MRAAPSAEWVRPAADNAFGSSALQTTVPRPEFDRRDDGKAFGERQQVLVTCDQVISPFPFLRSKQGAEHRQIVCIPQLGVVCWQRVDDFSLDREDVEQVVDLGRRESMSVSQ